MEQKVKKKVASLKGFKHLLKILREGHHDNEAEVSQLVYDLFVRLGTEKYNKQSFLKIASSFINDFGNYKLEKEGNEKYYTPFQEKCIQYLLDRGGPGSDKMKEEILKCLKHNLYQTTVKDELEISDSVEEEMNNFLQLYDNHIKEFLKNRDNFYNEYKKGEGKHLIYVFVLMGALENCLINDHFFQHLESNERIYYLISPSHIHYRAFSQQTVFMYLRPNLFNGPTIKGLLQEYKPKHEKVYLFTF